MQLRVETHLNFKNLDVVRRTLEESSGEETAELSNGTGAAQLRWVAPTREYSRAVRIAIPLSWMDNAEKVDDLKAAVQHFALGVRSASRGL